MWDGAENVVMDKENEWVRHKIKHFIVGRCRNSGYGQGKRVGPT